MKTLDFIQIIFFILFIIAVTPVLGKFMFSVFSGKKNILTPILGKIEQLIYKLLGIKADEEIK